MKKLFSILPCLLLLAFTSFADPLPNDKVLKSFKETFYSAENVQWFEHKDFCEVSFTQSDIKASVKYDLAGNFIGSTRYYNEQNLPTNVLCKLKKNYPNKVIFGVTEIASADDINYYVKLEDGKSWITIKVDTSGQMDVYEKFKKA